MDFRETFLAQLGLADCALVPMAGDASIKKFYRITPRAGYDARGGGDGGETYVLMEMPVDDSVYTHEAGLASDCVPFLAVGEWLHGAGIRVPEVIGADVSAGLILLEDLGGSPYHKTYLPLAVELLNHLQKTAPPEILSYGCDRNSVETESYTLPTFNQEIYMRELALFVEWFLPAHKIVLENGAKEDFFTFWRASWNEIKSTGDKIVLRDYHSPNFLFLQGEKSFRQLAVLDYQDALRGSPLYDLVSITQDARMEISAEEETTALAAYSHPLNEAAYALLGAQRALKILGIFHRFAAEGNRHYLSYLPIVKTYLARNLLHSSLADLRSWLSQQTGGSL